MDTQEQRIPDGMKWQKICHDDSSPPFSSFCTYCSGGQKCYSDDKRLVREIEPNETHISTIAEENRNKENALAFWKWAEKLDTSDKLNYDRLYDLFIEQNKKV